jgi:hypothetical protein
VPGDLDDRDIDAIDRGAGDEPDADGWCGSRGWHVSIPDVRESRFVSYGIRVNNGET